MSCKFSRDKSSELVSNNYSTGEAVGNVRRVSPGNAVGISDRIILILELDNLYLYEVATKEKGNSINNKSDHIYW